MKRLSHCAARLSGRSRIAGLLGLLAGAALLAGCAGLGRIADGTPRDAVLSRWGQPTAAVRLSDGERLQYSLQPHGQQAWMVDLDAAGRVRSVRQVLVPAEFNRVEPGRWSRADVEREFGPPALVDRVTSWDGDVLTYRWKDSTDMFFWVYLDAAGTVQRTQYGMDFVNSPSDRD